MKCIILCAGYATRLYPLTKSTPKHLLPVNGKPILNYILEKIPVNIFEDIFLITNEKFYSNFIDWKNQQAKDYSITVINDHTTSNEDRLGSIGDVHYVFKKTRFYDDFLLVSGDNLFNFSLEPMMKKHSEGKNVVALYDVNTIDEARKMATASTDSKGIITEVVEKPENPDTTICSIGIYLFQKQVIGLLTQYINEAKSLDHVGDFIAWLCNETTIHAYTYGNPDDRWLDIGTPSQLEFAGELFRN